jgi:hypothetical protein
MMPTSKEFWDEVQTKMVVALLGVVLKRFTILGRQARPEQNLHAFIDRPLQNALSLLQQPLWAIIEQEGVQGATFVTVLSILEGLGLPDINFLDIGN